MLTLIDTNWSREMLPEISKGMNTVRTFNSNNFPVCIHQIEYVPSSDGKSSRYIVGDL